MLCLHSRLGCFSIGATVWINQYKFREPHVFDVSYTQRLSIICEIYADILIEWFKQNYLNKSWPH